MTDAGGQIRCHTASVDEDPDVFGQMCWLMDTMGVQRHIAELLACMLKLGVAYLLTPQEQAHWEDCRRRLQSLRESLDSMVVTGKRGGGGLSAHSRR